MIFDRNKLYTLLFAACLVGYIWLYIIIDGNLATIKAVEVCIIKNITNIPCPSCGTTRSIITLIKGNISQALYLNPIGLLVAIIMLLSPIWIIVDIVTKRDSLFIFYNKVEHHLQKAKYAIPLIFLVVINWIWTITKAL